MDILKLPAIFSELFGKLVDIDYVLIGSLNLKLQGLATEPKDVDFLTTDSGVYTVSKLFKSQITSEHEYLETEFFIDGVEIHFTSCTTNEMRPLDFMRYVVMLKKYGHSIPCMSLRSELDAYRNMNRERDKEKIAMIEEKLLKESN